MIPTPDLTHLRPEDYEHVYDPAEDTFILLDALEQDAEQLRSMGPQISLEIGVIGSKTQVYLCTDINARACECSLATGRQNKWWRSRLRLSTPLWRIPLLARLHRSVDIVLFNPPYVPTVPDEALGAQEDRDIEGSWAGGQDGMQITDRVFPQVADLLSPHGRFYLVAVVQNNIPDIQQRMQENYALESQVVLQRRAGREHLSVILFTRAK
ncbi:hypothetical protein DFH06DRAFT_1201853 [Mycena polygramma]|nr:hypothetical protein DFH06DRAFT_1201853 [Mycena polygramma]